MNLPVKQPKTIAIVMAGNLPLVGFHDLLCVLLSGHRAKVKLSSKDDVLIPWIVKHLESFKGDIADWMGL